MANHFGHPLQAYLGNEFRVTQKGDGSYEATDSYTAPYSSVQTILRNLIGSDHTREGWTFLRVESWTVEPNRSDLCKLVVNLSSNSNEGEFDDDTATAEDYTYELAITTSEDPIESHFRYREGQMSRDEHDTVQYVKLGSYKYNKTQSTDEDFVFDNVNGNEASQGDPRHITSGPGRELVTYVMRGVLTYLRARQIWREKWVDDKLPAAKILNKVGHIKPAKGLPTLSDDRDTLLVGLNCTQNGKRFDTVAEYEVSGRGGWDVKIYGQNTPPPT